MKKISLVALLLLCGCQSNNAATTATEKQAERFQYLDMRHLPMKVQADGYWVQTQRSEPLYPIDAARKGLSGCVTLSIAITPEGKAGGYKVIQSYPEGVFDDAALQAVNKWRWEPEPGNSTRQAILIDTKLEFWVTQGQSNADEAQRVCQFASQLRR
ncbi:energy transducer TonB [Pseudoalteromonas sp. SCSIO 43201]|uniref:TonB C-terminal domain-containing protein n=1 Tax=Pseudoalteromonas peptidolytica F12-50-A1 TaxID=1315280 RepID=A0A8I0T6K8_9GAMM|nr:MULTISPECIES: energy transducer TonB [Pseudoalteromonas]MBE0349245.1 hypothetical protein [Pseudoalteromonas peptidolytica F12-50-A1]MDW7549050.1 energy transducer TonB [Pseudoalteromonas peptidolytica]NLR16463.1 energy transducer TonB [Pseudoalteromonas peptidolytica]USD30252.1 energy transducer TonB [Pseudoalteromonas sp. SCSIO 43201]GEK09813.1 hypothetical protein PPE03_20620 [Pseudoalteromonas peptidolytica]